MELQNHYNRMWNESFPAIKTNRIECDPLLDNDNDRRFGLTLLARPPKHICKIMVSLLDDLKWLEPEQYYYPEHDFHLTILSIISCYTGFSAAHIYPHDYIQRIADVVADFRPIPILFSGITASPAAVLIRGFSENATLNGLRNKLRESFRDSSLQQSIDKRYGIKTAHSTVMRFRKPLQNPKLFSQKLTELKNMEIGKFEIKELELVTNDWYQRQRNTTLLHTFRL